MTYYRRNWIGEIFKELLIGRPFKKKPKRRVSINFSTKKAQKKVPDFILKKRMRNSQSHVKWTPEADKNLKAEFEKERDIEKLSTIFQRSTLSIYCRLRKLSLIEINPDFEKLLFKKHS